MNRLFFESVFLVVLDGFWEESLGGACETIWNLNVEENLEQNENQRTI